MSPILLLMFRLCQGLSAGGEHTGSAVYISELVSHKHRIFWLSTVPTSAACGIVISSIIAYFITHTFTDDELLSWGWRVGYIADYMNHKIILFASCILMMIFSYPLFALLSSGSLQKIIIAMSVFTVIFSLYLPTAFINMVELFHTEIRYTGLSFGFNLALALFGGTCPLIVTWLIHVTNNNSSPAFYMMFAALIAFLVSYYYLDDDNKFEPVFAR